MLMQIMLTTERTVISVHMEYEIILHSVQGYPCRYLEVGHEMPYPYVANVAGSMDELYPTSSLSWRMTKMASIAPRPVHWRQDWITSWWNTILICHYWKVSSHHWSLLHHLSKMRPMFDI